MVPTKKELLRGSAVSTSFTNDVSKIFIAGPSAIIQSNTVVPSATPTKDSQQILASEKGSSKNIIPGNIISIENSMVRKSKVLITNCGTGMRNATPHDAR